MSRKHSTVGLRGILLAKRACRKVVEENGTKVHCFQIYRQVVRGRLLCLSGHSVRGPQAELVNPIRGRV